MCDAGISKRCSTEEDKIVRSSMNIKENRKESW
jgi:hypothetical protein